MKNNSFIQGLKVNGDYKTSEDIKKIISSNMEKEIERLAEELVKLPKEIAEGIKEQER